MSVTSRTVVCARCQRRRRHSCRGLCSTCYDVVLSNGTVDEYVPARLRTQHAVLPLALAGHGPAVIAARLGITDDAARGAIRSLRMKGSLPMPTVDDLTPDPEPDDDALPVVDRWPSPPAPPACDGVDPALFTELGPMREFLDRRGMPATWAQMRLQAAFAYCARCPVQDWCIDVAVRPEASGATIVAGGALFVNGERRWGIDELLADDEAAS